MVFCFSRIMQLQQQYRSQFAALLVWRFILCASALWVVLDRPLEKAIFPLVLLAGLLMVGETAYKWIVHVEQEKARLEREREWKRQRAEDARMRMEAELAKAEQADNRIMSFGMDDDIPEAKAPANPHSTMSERDFEMATLGVSPEIDGLHR